MAIRYSKYIDIFSTAGGKALVAEKQPIGRWFTTNPLAPMGAVIEFSNAKNVMNYFGAESKEYAYAYKYFKFISKTRSRPRNISFARYTTSAVGASIISGKNTFDYEDFVGITAAKLTITYNDPTSGTISGTTKEFSLASTTSMSDLVTTIRSEISQIEVDGKTPFADVTVEYENTKPQLNGARVILTLPTGFGTFDFATDDGESNLASLLGWDIGSPAILSAGNAGTNTLYEEIDRVFNISNNCYTYTFIEALTADQKEEAAKWTHDANGEAMFCLSENSVANALAQQAALANYDGVWIQFDNTLDELQIYQPMAAQACVNYNKPNASINLMYQQFAGDTPVVTTDAISDQLDAKKINYYGGTQNAGQPINFLQRGKCQGSFADATVFLNSIWLKNQVVVKTLSLFLGRNAVPSNTVGSALITTKVSNTWAQGVNNGTILENKALDTNEIAFIENITNDEYAYLQVQKTGVWFKCEVETSTDPTMLGEKVFNYTLIYAAADQIRKVVGTHIGITSAQ